MAIKASVSEQVGFGLRSTATDSGPDGGAREVDLAPEDTGGLDVPAFGPTGGKAALADRVGSPFDDAAAQDAGPRFGKDAIADVTSGVTPGSPVAFTNSAGEVKNVGSAATGDGMFLGVDVGAMRMEQEANEQAAEFDANRGSGSGSGSGGEGDGGGSGGGSGGSGGGEGGDSGTGIVHEQENADGSHSSVYDDGTIITTHADGTQVTSYADGTVETDHPDGTLVTEYADGSTQTIHPDGTIDETPPTEPEGDDGEGDDPPPDGDDDTPDDTPDDDEPEGNPDGDGESAESTPGDDEYDIPPDLILTDDLAGLSRHRGGQNDPGTETQPTEGDIDFGAGTPSGAVPDLRTKLLGDPDELDKLDGIDAFGAGARGPVGEVPVGNVDGNVDPGFDADPGVQTSGPEERDTSHEIEPPARDTDDSGSDDDHGFARFDHHELRETDDGVPDDLPDLLLDLA
ncbi:MAG: T-complex 10 C-terminal domain-containing protein [Pseudonocardia sp.]